MDLVLIIFFAVLSILFSILKRAYGLSSGKNLLGNELEPMHQRIFTRISNNKNLINSELWVLILFSATICLISIQNYFDGLLQLVLSLLFVWLIFIYLQNYHPGSLSGYFAKRFSGAILKTITPMKKYFGFLNVFFPADKSVISPIYDEKDLADFLNSQASNKNSKLDEKLIARLIRLSEKNYETVGEIMKKIDIVKKVNAEEEIGPVLIDELHKSGAKYFLVENTKDDELVGYVKLTDLTSLKKTGKIQGITHKDLEYIEITDDSFELIDAFLASGTPIYLVRDSGETVGVVTIDDCLEQLIET